MRVLFFGRLGEVAGTSETGLDLPAEVASLSALRSLLGRGNPALGEALAQPSVRVAVDGTIAHGDALPHRTSEIAFLPPVSGG